MAIEIRRPNGEEMPAIRALGRYAFANNTPPADENPVDFAPDWVLAAFDDGRPVASSGAFPFEAQLNGRTVKADGVTGVSTDPGYRRRGLLRQLMSGLLRRSHDNGVPLSILWASMGAIYQRFGYGLASYHVRYELDPRHVAFQFGDGPSGHTRRLDTAEALETLPAIYREYARPRNLLLHRNRVIWESMLRRQGDRETHAAVHYDPDGRAEGYCIYQAYWPGPDTPMPNHVMHVNDLAWTSTNGYRGLWQYLCAHDLVSRLIWMRVPEDDPALAMLEEPRRLNRRTDDGIWLRVVDVRKALAVRGYDLPGEVTVRVVDDALCPWNEGCYRLHTDGDGREASVERLDGTEAHMEVTPNALASLLAGHFSASELWRAGRLKTLEPGLLPGIDALFSTRYRPTCANHF